MTNEELVNKIKAEKNNSDYMLQLYRQTKKFIIMIAKEYVGKAEMEDLEQEGYLALYDAIEGYDPDRGCKFLTYAKYWIKQAMTRYIQNTGSTVRIPSHACEKLQDYKKLINAFWVCYGRKPNIREIAYNLKLSIEQVISIEKSAEMERLGSLDSYIFDDGCTLKELVASPIDIESDVLDKVEQEQLINTMWIAVDSLQGNMPQIIRSRYQENKTIKEIGNNLGIPIERVRTIEHKALRELRKPNNIKSLRPFLTLDENIYNMGIVGNGAKRFNTTWTSSTEQATMQLLEGRLGTD